LKKVIISVTNDLISDQRVHRTATTLSEAGIDVLLIGRKLPSSQDLPVRQYKMIRMQLLFHKKFIFYLNYNIRLFFFLLFHKADGLFSNDLDTLPANFLISKIKSIPLVFDSHELFTEVPELKNRHFVKKIWALIEKILLPGIRYGITVCNSIAGIYKDKYKVDFTVIRNMPYKINALEKTKINIDKTKKIIIYQGALNMGRGIETMIDTMKFLDNTVFLIAGEGDISKQLRERVKVSALENKVMFVGKIQLNDLYKYTLQADLGISIEENMGLNYFYALPNKLFDYIQAQIPVITSDFPEMGAIVNKYKIGIATNEKNPEKLASIVFQMLHDKEKINNWKQNLKTASNELCWEKERSKLLMVAKNAGFI
jgi:glycosyltransferase involved in cell wall biosynthesis